MSDGPDVVDIVRERPWQPLILRMRYEPEAGAPAESGPAGLGLPPVPGPDPPPLLDRPLERAALQAEMGEYLRVFVEVLAGLRPSAQLTRLLAPTALHYWQTAAGQRRRGAPPPRLTQVLVCRPHPGAVEVAGVVVEADRRAWALPARFERTRPGRWCCMEIRILR